jgi:hypothetical protein
LATEFLLNSLAAGDISVADVTVKPFQILDELTGVEFKLHAAGSTRASIVG